MLRAPLSACAALGVLPPDPRRLIKHPFELQKLEEAGRGLEGKREPSPLLEQIRCLLAQRISISAASAQLRVSSS